MAMAMQFLILLLFWPTLSTVTVAASVNLTKPNCPETCGDGNIEIPYPFGVGKGCFLDEWFVIECRNSGSNKSSVPFLKKANLEVLKIMLPNGTDPRPTGLIRVNSPILSSGCQGIRSAGEAVNFTGSTFVYSQEKSIFSASGCNSRATINPSKPGGNQVRVECLSRCSTNGSASISNCCQATISTFLDAFNVTFNSSRPQECAYAFLVDKDWFSEETNKSSCASFMRDLVYAPAFLEWSVLATKMPEQIERERSVGFFFSCGTGYADSEVNPDNLTLQCYCDNGYEGNPYLGHKCEDIDECLWDPTFTCNGTGTCENFGGSFRCVSKKVNVSGLIIGLGSGFGLLFLAAGVWWLYKLIKKRNKAKRKQHFFKRNGGLLLQQQLSSCQGNVEQTNVFSSKELEKATDRFNANRVLGQGGQGTVYKGMLPDGRIVAVKKSKIENVGEIESFINEVVILSQINHRNIVKLLGCCLETEVPLLVYEFVPNGTLSQYLHENNEEFMIVSWKMRLQIASEVAGALSYLHSTASTPIFHRDIKSANILLDLKYRAKVADFGTSRSVAIDQTHLTTLVHGTFGYLDPEYFQSSQYTDKSDVYSFGVVLVELLTGQRAISTTRSQEGRSLATYFIMTMERDELFDILDAQVVEQGGRGEIAAVANLAKRCLHLNGRNRPTMREVTKELESISASQKAVAVEGNHEEIEYVRSQETEPWDASSASTTSRNVNCISPNTVAALPLLPFRTW